jgi:hypothetical protein
VRAEPDALFEEALQEEEQQELDVDHLANEIVTAAWHMADGDPVKLRHAAAILARTKYLEGSG